MYENLSFLLKKWLSHNKGWGTKFEQIVSTVYYTKYPKIPGNLFGRSAQLAKIFGIFKKTLICVPNLCCSLCLSPAPLIKTHSFGKNPLWHKAIQNDIVILTCHFDYDIRDVTPRHWEALWTCLTLLGGVSFCFGGTFIASCHLNLHSNQLKR